MALLTKIPILIVLQVFLQSSWFFQVSAADYDLNRTIDHPCRTSHARRSLGESDGNYRTHLEDALVAMTEAANGTLIQMVRIREIKEVHEPYPFVDQFKTENINSSLQNEAIVWIKIGVNFYHYTSAVYQLSVNERYTEHLQGHSFQHHLRSLLKHQMRSVACHLKQVLRQYVPIENQSVLDEAKTKVKSITYQPIQEQSMIDADEMAYVVLHTFVDDFLDFCIRFLRQSSVARERSASAPAQ